MAHFSADHDVDHDHAAELSDHHPSVTLCDPAEREMHGDEGPCTYLKPKRTSVLWTSPGADSDSAGLKANARRSQTSLIAMSTRHRAATSHLALPLRALATVWLL